MTYRKQYDLSEDQVETIAEVFRVVNSIRDQGTDADADDVKKLQGMFKPGRPDEVGTVTIEEEP